LAKEEGFLQFGREPEEKGNDGPREEGKKN